MESNNYRRVRKKKSSKIDALNHAQNIAFAPLTFQAVATMLDLGILKLLASSPSSVEKVMKELKLSEYIVTTLFDVATAAKLIDKKGDLYELTDLAEAFLYDEMTIANFNFTKDVCYLGASELTESFVSEKPVGLHKFFSDAETIYPIVPKLPESVKKSWYDFDHFYSNDCFDEILKIMFKDSPKNIYDIGGNTGNFEKTCVRYNSECKVTMFDLPVNREAAIKNVNSDRLTFRAMDVLKDEFPEMDGAVFMSQFLDCFSKAQIITILNKVAKVVTANSRIYILEPFVDNQVYPGAAYALSHISLYFTAMANGVSKMYNEYEMLDLIEKSDLKLVKKYYDIGKHSYTLLECMKK